MIIRNYYLSEPGNLCILIESTELALDEIEEMVGYFAKHSSRAGQMRGEVIVYADGSHAIRHAFTKKLIWREL